MGPRTRIWLGIWIMHLLTAASFALPADDLRLIDAVKNRNRAAVRFLLEERVNVNATGPDGATALAWAANRDDLETADLLIRAGANVNAAADHGVTPLSLACTNRNSRMVESLLKAGANPNTIQSTGETPLVTCAHTGNSEAVKSLLSHGADPNVKESQQGHTPLMRAIAGKHSEVTRILVGGGADVRARSTGGFTALLFASQQGDIESARVLLSAGADIDETTPENGTALVVAAASGHEAFAIFLVENGADPNAADAYGVTALHYTVPLGYAGIDSVSVIYRPYEVLPSNMPQLARVLLSHKASPNAQIKKDFPPYSRSPYALQTSVVGATSFLLASAAADVEIMRILLEGGADPSLTLKDGSNALMLAAGVGRVNERRNKEEEAKAVQTAGLALELGNDIHAANARGRTAMHGAAGIGADSMIQFLVEKGANLDAKDRQGNTPLTVAAGRVPRGDGANRIYESTMNLLLKSGAQSLK